MAFGRICFRFLFLVYCRYVINNAHNQGVSAIACTSDCRRVISGGGEGQVRVWIIGDNTHTLEGAMKEHKSSIACIKVEIFIICFTELKLVSPYMVCIALITLKSCLLHLKIHPSV